MLELASSSYPPALAWIPAFLAIIAVITTIMKVKGWMDERKFSEERQQRQIDRLYQELGIEDEKP